MPCCIQGPFGFDGLPSTLLYTPHDYPLRGSVALTQYCNTHPPLAMHRYVLSIAFCVYNVNMKLDIEGYKVVKTGACKYHPGHPGMDSGCRRFVQRRDVGVATPAIHFICYRRQPIRAYGIKGGHQGMRSSTPSHNQ